MLEMIKEKPQTSSIPRLGWRPIEFADSIGVSENFVRKEIKLGRLKARKIGDCVVILTTDAAAYLESQPEIQTK